MFSSSKQTYSDILSIVILNITPTITNIIPIITISVDTWISITNDVMIPKTGKIGTPFMLPGTLNASLSLFGSLILKNINVALIIIKTVNTVKFVRFAINFRSPKNNIAIEPITMAKIAKEVDNNFFDVFEL